MIEKICRASADVSCCYVHMCINKVSTFYVDSIQLYSIMFHTAPTISKGQGNLWAHEPQRKPCMMQNHDNLEHKLFQFKCLASSLKMQLAMLCIMSIYKRQSRPPAMHNLPNITMRLAEQHFSEAQKSR